MQAPAFIKEYKVSNFTWTVIARINEDFDIDEEVMRSVLYKGSHTEIGLGVRLMEEADMNPSNYSVKAITELGVEVMNSLVQWIG